MARPRLVHAAAQQAGAEYNPQIRGVRREKKSQLRSINSMGPALEASLAHSAQQLRHAGLSPRDLAIAETELAHRTADVGASTALQGQQVTQDAHGEIMDLLQSRGQAQGAALSTLLQQAAEHRQGVADEEQAEFRGLKNSLLKEQLEKEGHLGDYATSGAAGGLTPTQQRAASEDHHAAAHYAKEYVRLAKEGLKDDKTGAEILPAGPSNWNDDQWNLFVDKVASKGVDVSVAERAVKAIRDHFQPDAGNPLDALKRVASVAIPALAPKPLQPVAQMAGAYLGR